jgi:hypothetical protein
MVKFSELLLVKSSLFNLALLSLLEIINVSELPLFSVVVEY